MTTPLLKPSAQQLAGRLVVSGDPEWDERVGRGIAVDQLTPRRGVRRGRRRRRRGRRTRARRRFSGSVVQCTGHNAAPVGSLERTILLKTERMRQVEVDPVATLPLAAKRECCGPRWVGLPAEHGLAPLAGTSPDVGVVGYTIGGGVSWLGRKHGLAANSVLAVELVTADGGFVRADRDNEPDLFWALRGGGGSFGIVTALEFALYPVAELYAGVLFWADRAGRRDTRRVARVGRDGARRGLVRRSAAAIPADPRRARAFPGPLLRGRRGGPPHGRGGRRRDHASTPRARPRAGYIRRDTADVTDGAPHGSGAPRTRRRQRRMLSDLTAEAIDAAVEAVVGSSLLTFELRHIGGTLAVAAPENGALASLQGRFLYFGAGIALAPEAKAAVERHVELVQAALAPWDAGLTFLNFMERPTEPRALLPAGGASAAPGDQGARRPGRPVAGKPSGLIRRESDTRRARCRVSQRLGLGNERSAAVCGGRPGGSSCGGW